ncbi:PadR family transcriptional regulator [Arthrobacter psychrochitiniphilus]|uniref:PadR family transcriptional regulator n=1 Tax=Arthrobacter psychrochitiniphilus TaxID=291045 RepID=UPI003F7BC556
MTSSLEEPWPSDWNRASLGLCALQALEAGPTYGYAIITALENAGLGTFKGGTLYPLLTRFETAGWLEVEWRPGANGPGRKYFSLTPAGAEELTKQQHQWLTFTDRTTAFLTESPVAAETATHNHPDTATTPTRVARSKR